MKRSTAENHEKRLRGVYSMLYQSATLQRIKHKTLMEEAVKYVWGDPCLKNCPQWVHHGLFIHRDHLNSLLYSHWLRWGYESSDGIIMQFCDLSAEDKQNVNDGVIVGHHYWLKTISDTENMINNVLIREKKMVITKDYF